MFAETLLQHMAPSRERPNFERRQATRRGEDRLGEQAQQERARKLHSLLELGQIIGLDLQLHDMLLQIAQKAREVMAADRK